MDSEKRIRREIANSNERRRMQSINAGFQSLRNLLPKHEGEKLSKAAILQQTAEYIYTLEQEKTRLLSQNSCLKRLLSEYEGADPPPKRRKPLDDVADDDDYASPTKPSAEVCELRAQLDRERRARARLEDRVREFETQALYDDDPHDLDLATLDDRCSSRLVSIEPPLLEDDDSAPPPSRSPSLEVEAAAAAATLLEAAIKAEPKVEVEQLPGRSPSTSRQNLETIVEAIRHLEGDHMFAEHHRHEQLSPLALTAADKAPPPPLDQRRLALSDYLQFRQPPASAQQSSRPGVIVAKHS